MKNNHFFLLILKIIIFILLFSGQSQAQDVFNFDITEVEIVDNGNTFIGKKRGTASSENNVHITADNFRYDKILNILYADGDVLVDDKEDGVKIYTQEITYLKDKEVIFSKTRSKATDKISSMEGDEFKYNKKLNILNVIGNVIIKDTQKDYNIITEEIFYFKNKEVIETKGDTEAIIESKYNFQSKNVLLLRNEMELSSLYKTTVKDDDFNVYKLKKFKYLINEELLKGEDIQVITNYSKPKSDTFFFTNGIFDFKKKKFIAKDTKVFFHKELFDKERLSASDLTEEEKQKAEKFKGQNDPRIFGSSSNGDEEKTIIHKGVFTSCKLNDTCPPWSMEARKVTHDKIKKNIIYDNAIINVYDIPVFYFPKFFHPDPTVKRRSGLLQPRLNNSNIVGTSLNLPYFHVISDSKDFTFKPTIFDNRIYMFQNEYRQKNENSQFIADFGYTKGYQSQGSSNRNGMSHLFSKLNIDFGFENFINSKLDIFLEKVSMDTYLKIFQDVLITDKTLKDDLKDTNTLTSGFKLALDHEDYNLTTGMTAYESLQTAKNSDRFQYVFPYYSFSKDLISNFKGKLAFSSSGNNRLSNTNNLKTIVSNNLNYTSNNMYSMNGFVNNYGVFFRNLNSVGKNDSEYKSSVQSEILNIYEVNTALPLIKEIGDKLSYLTPRASFRINPSDMKDHSGGGGLITTDNVFSINRLGLSDSYESGKSLTLGIDYRKENQSDIDKFLEIKFATVLRDTPEYKIPRSSSAQGKMSNLFGSVENTLSDNLSFDYNFQLDNDFRTFEYNSFSTELKLNNFVTEFRFSEANGKVGDSNYLQNETTFNFDDNNSLVFQTRRNRKISLTEYYDFIYEYQNDCLTAALKYRKTYYKDRDLVPKEDFFFTITLFPLTTLDQKIDKKLYRDDNNELIWK